MTDVVIIGAGAAGLLCTLAGGAPAGLHQTRVAPPDTWPHHYQLGHSASKVVRTAGLRPSSNGCINDAPVQHSSLAQAHPTWPISVCARVGVRPNLSQSMSNHS